MNYLSMKKMNLPGKALLLSLLMFVLPFANTALGQSTNCKVDFAFEVNHNTKTVKFKARSNKQAVVFGWSLGDGSFVRGEQVSHTYASEGTYRVCVKAIAFDSTSNQRCTTELCKAVTLVDCDRLEAKFNVEQRGLTVAVRGKANSNHVVYGFSFGDGTSLRGNPLKHVYKKAGVYEICMIAKDTLYGCVARVCKKVRVEDDGCDLRAKFDYRNEGAVFKFKAVSNVKSARYTWDFGDRNSGTGQDVKHRYNAPGKYKVCLTVYAKSTNSNDICTTRVCKVIDVRKKQCDLKADFKYRIANNKLYVEGRANEKNVHFFWTYGDGTDGHGQSARHKYKKPGTYEVCLVVFNSKTKCKVCICKRIVITPKCRLKAKIMERQNRNVVAFKARSNASHQAVYYWEFGDGSSSYGKHTRHTYTKKGVYHVTLIVSDKKAGCRIKRETMVYIGVRRATALDATNATITQSKTSKPADQLIASPNWTASVAPLPATSTVAISSKDKEIAKVKIYGADGLLVLEVHSSLDHIDITTLSKGFYYGHVYAADGTMTMVKIVKES